MTHVFAEVPFADAWSMHGGDVGFGWWMVMTLGMIAFWGAIIALVVWMLRGGAAASRPPPSAPEESSPREILDRRLADGSLSVEDYERRRRLLEEAGGDGVGSRDPAAIGADR
jgi:putative membrane protein